MEVVVITRQKLFSFSHCWTFHCFYSRFVNESQQLKAVVFPFFFPLSLTRRSWSLRKQLSHLRCASRSTTVWEESLSRRWASPPRSALTPAGPRATSLSFSPTLWCDVLMYFLFSVSLLPSLTLSVTSHHTTPVLSFSFVILHHTSPKSGKPQPPTPKHPLARTSCTPLITFNHCLHTSMVTAAVSMEIFNKPKWVRLCFTCEIIVTNYLL